MSNILWVHGCVSLQHFYNKVESLEKASFLQENNFNAFQCSMLLYKHLLNTLNCITFI